MNTDSINSVQISSVDSNCLIYGFNSILNSNRFYLFNPKNI